MTDTSQALKPVSVKLTIKVNVADYKLALAKSYNVSPEDIELVFEDERREPKKEALIAPTQDKPKENLFLKDFLKANHLKRKEAAMLCGVSVATIYRVSHGYRIENPCFDKIVAGLGLTADQATALRNTLNRKNQGYTK